MLLYIDRDNTETNLSPKMDDFRELLTHIHFENRPNDIPVNVGVSIRTLKDNTVLCEEDQNIVFKTPLVPMGVEISTFSIILSIKEYLSQFNLDGLKMQLDTQLQAIGYYFDDTTESFIIYFHLLIKDESLLINELAEKTNNMWVKIQDLSLNSSLGCNTIVLPTLKIVG